MTSRDDPAEEHDADELGRCRQRGQGEIVALLRRIANALERPRGGRLAGAMVSCASP